MKVSYLANARLPTEKAHGYQIVKMCQAFSELGQTVNLLHPYRRQPDPTLRSVDPFQYYGVPQVFEIQTLKNLDVMTLSAYAPKSLAPHIFFVHSFLWSLYATMIARRQGADVYYTRSLEIAYWLLRLGMPTVLEVHSVPRKSRKWLLQRILRKKSLQLVVTLTSFVKDRLTALDFHPSRVKVAPDGVDLAQFEHLPKKLEVRHQLALPRDRPIIGYVGRFETMGLEKGIPQLIDAMAHLPSINGKGPLLLCVGGPMSRVRDYLERADSKGISRHMLKFVDRVPNRDVPLWLNALDVAVMPFPETEHYKYYMSPLKLFEYMAAGVPIVASDLPSIREILQHDRNAWLVPPGNSDSLGEAILALLRDPARSTRLAATAKEDARQYSWRNRAQSILDQIQ